jgi:transmembrane sensor
MADHSLQHDRDDSTDIAFGDVTWAALARYIGGESPADESQRVERWIAEHPDDATTLAALDLISRSDATYGRDGAAERAWHPSRRIDTEAALAAVRQKARRSLTLSRANGGRRGLSNVRLFGPLLTGLAAAALIVTLGARLIARTASNGEPPRIVKTAAGQLDSTLLTDGTRILVAPSSRVTVDGRSRAPTRDVMLVGEARFVVRHDARRPFVVHAGNAVIRDIGTSFTVQADSGSQGVAVSVQEGAISIGRADKPDENTVVRTGERVVLYADGHLTRELADAETDTSWTHGRLIFRDAPMSRVRSELRRWYGIDLETSDSSLATRRLTATFETEPAAEVLRIVALALGAQVKQQGQTVTLVPRP